jgi:hypothetical protein
VELKYLHTQDGITVVVEGKPYSISSRHSSFPKVRDLVISGADPVKILGAIQAEATRVKGLIAETLQRQRLTGSLTYEEGVVFYNGTALHNYAVETLVKFLNMGHDVSALAAFIDRQQQNPDPMVHENLYAFLEHGKIPLTPDGHFLTYKAVREDYRDIHSGRFDNSVGAKPRLAGRASVDPDRNNTCSNGLHVCSYGYLPHFAHAQGHVMICKVDPYDVVAIPADYHNTKMRVIGYEVVGEVTSYYKRGEDVLAQERLADERWRVEYEEPDAVGVRELYDHFYTLDEAKDQADSLIDDGSSTIAWVVDTRTGKTVYATR